MNRRSTGDDYICEQMRNYTQKHGAVPTFYVAANQPEAADSTTETGVARVLAKSVCMQQPIKMGLHFFHPSEENAADGSPKLLSAPLVVETSMARQITHSEVESPVIALSKSEQPVKLPHDFQFRFSMKCGDDGVETLADGVHVGSVARLSDLTEPGDVYVVQHPLYAKSEYPLYAAKKLPVSTALLKLRDQGERGVELVSARVVSNFLPAEQMDLHHYGVASTVGAVETMGEELSSVAIGAEDEEANFGSISSSVGSPQKRLRSAIVEKFSKELSDGGNEQLFALRMGYGDDNRLSDEIGKSRAPAFWGTGTYALSCVALCSMVARHSGDIWQERMRDHQYLLRLLGDEVAAGVRSVYAAYNAANSDALNLQEAPTMEQLVLGTSGLPMRFLVGQKEEGELQERLIESLQAEHRRKLTPAENMEALHLENEKRLAYAFTWGQVQMMRGPGEMPNDSPSMVEAALIAVLLVALMKRLEIKDEKFTESAILAGVHTLVDFDTRVDWNPIMSADGTSLRGGVGTSLLSAGSGLVSSLEEATKLPAAMSKTYEKVSGYLHSLKVSNELLHPNISHLGASWMNSDIADSLSLVVTTIGEEGISAGAMFYIPQRSIWGVWQLDVRSMSPKEASSLVERLLAALPEAVASYNDVEKDNGVFSAATRVPRYVPHAVRRLNPASYSKKERSLVKKKLGAIRSSTDFVDHVLTLCQSTPLQASLRLNDDGQRMHLVPSDQKTTSIGTFTYSPAHECFVEVNSNGSLGDLVKINNEGLSIGGRFYSSSESLSRNDELQKLVDQTLSTSESLDSEHVLDSIFGDDESAAAAAVLGSRSTAVGSGSNQQKPPLLVNMQVRDSEFKLDLNSNLILGGELQQEETHFGEHYYSGEMSDSDESAAEEEEATSIGARRGGRGAAVRRSRAHRGVRRATARARRRASVLGRPRFSWRGGRRYVYRNGAWWPWVAAAAVAGGALALTDAAPVWGHSHRSHHPFVPALALTHPHYVHHQDINALDGYSPYY